MKQEKGPSETDQRVLDYIRKSKASRETVWLSEAVEELGIDPKEVLRSAKRLQEQGLLKPKQIG